MRRSTHRLAALALGCLLLAPVASASHKYQVTGQVVEVSDKVIVVMKDKEKFEIDRTADTKIEGELKVGAKVTVHYHMVADDADAKK